MTTSSKDGLRLFTALVTPDMDVTLEEIGATAHGKHGLLGVALGVRPRKVRKGASACTLLVQIPDAARGRAISVDRIRQELLPRRRAVQAALQGERVRLNAPWVVHTLEAAQPTHSLREFSIGNGRLFADRFSHQVSAFAFDLPTAQRAKLRRDGEIGEMQSVAQRAMDDRSFDPQVSDLLRRLEAKAPTDPTDILRYLIDPDPDMLVLEAH